MPATDMQMLGLRTCGAEPRKSRRPHSAGPRHPAVPASPFSAPPPPQPWPCINPLQPGVSLLRCGAAAALGAGERHCSGSRRSDKLPLPTNIIAAAPAVPPRPPAAGWRGGAASGSTAACGSAPARIDTTANRHCHLNSETQGIADGMPPCMSLASVAGVSIVPHAAAEAFQAHLDLR